MVSKGYHAAYALHNDTTTSIMPQMLYTSHVQACSQAPTLMLTARGAQPSQGLADHKALTARVLVCHARGEPRMRGVADVGVSSDPRLGTTIAARICGGGVAATPASDAAPSHGAAQEAGLALQAGPAQGRA